jgi:two-component sensor histidine kinase
MDYGPLSLDRPAKAPSAHNVPSELRIGARVHSRRSWVSSLLFVAKLALGAVNELLHSYADVHHALQMPEADRLIDAATYLRQLCLSISRSKLNHLEIQLVLAACPLLLRSDRCWRLGMIVYELITNAARHAFSDGKREIRVELLRAGSYVTCKVQDNGSPPNSVVPGRGLKIVHELVKTLNGNLKHKFGSHGSISLLAFPHSDGAQ